MIRPERLHRLDGAKNLSYPAGETRFGRSLHALAQSVLRSPSIPESTRNDVLGNVPIVQQIGVHIGLETMGADWYDRAHTREQLILFISLVAASSGQEDLLSNQLATLFYDELPDNHGIEVTNGVMDRRVEEIAFSYYFPESGGNTDWVMENIRQGDMIVLPDTIKKGNATLKKLCGAQSVPYFPFNGYTTYGNSYDAMVIWKNTRTKTIVHEREHLMWDGMMIGDFGYGLNEAMTELFTAMMFSPYNFSDFVVTSLAMEATHTQSDELLMLNRLIDRVHGARKTSFITALESRYKRSSEYSVERWMQELLTHFSLKEIAEIYRAMPKEIQPHVTPIWIPPSDVLVK